MWHRRAMMIVLIAVGAWVQGCAAADGPSVRPDDVVLVAKVLPSDVAACAPDVTWVVELELNHLKPGPLYGGEHAYMSEINLFDGANPIHPIAVEPGCGDGRSKFDAHDIGLGNDGRTYSLAVQAAIASRDLPPTFSALSSTASGFTYLGTDFPVKVRYYLTASRLPEKIAAVYAHYEEGHSWTKVVYADQSAVAEGGGPAPGTGQQSLPTCTAPSGWLAIGSPMRPGAFDPTDRNAVLVHGTDGRIWQYPLNGGDPAPITSRPYAAFSPSPDGRWIAARQVDSPEIWLIDRSTGEERSTGLHGEMVGGWRPDSGSFFFVSQAGDVGEYTPATDRTRWWATPVDIPSEYRSERTVVEVPGLPFAPTSPGQVSPDGKQLLWAGGGSNIATIFRLDLATGRLYAYPGTETDGVAPYWHPAGDRALFGVSGNRVLDLAVGKVTPLDLPINIIVDIDATGRLLGAIGEGCWAVGPLPQAVPAALVSVYHAVPRHFAADAHTCASDCSFTVTGYTGQQVLDWYATELAGLGWRSIHSPLPDSAARRFVRGDVFLSVAAWPLDRGTVVHLHRRPAPEVTEAEAVAIAAATHRVEDEVKWTARYEAAFDSGRYGGGVTHPVWEVVATFPRYEVTVWVDALTAEPFRIRESSDY